MEKTLNFLERSGLGKAWGSKFPRGTMESYSPDFASCKPIFACSDSTRIPYLANFR